MDFDEMDFKEIDFKKKNSNRLWGKGPKGNGFKEKKEMDF